MCGGGWVDVSVCVCGGLVTWIESTADHAREDDENKGQHLQIGSQKRCSFHVAHVFSREGPLDNHLLMQNKSSFMTHV